MPLFLHIADPHLLSAAASRPVDDHKVGLVPPGDRTTHHEVLRLTLERLGQQLANDHRALDAVIVTGDVADKNNEGGYEAFTALLDALGAVKPPPNRIVVVPGNHDVAMGLAPGDPRRYDHFIRFMRGAGFVTPLLSGVDRVPISPGDLPRHVVIVDDVQIVPVETSAYSQVSLDFGIAAPSWTRVEDTIRAGGSVDELDAIRKLRVVDAARISPTQLEAVRATLRMVPVAARPPLRMAVLHHHLLPVSIREEVKPYESLTNLGLLRQFLRDEGFSIVLHGHKHARFTYVDHISSYDVPMDRPSPVRVLSGAAASGPDMERADVFRLIEVEPNGGMIRVQRVGSAAPGGALALGAPDTLRFSRPGGAQTVETRGCTVIEGPTVDVVYPQLLAAVAVRAELDHVLTRIETAPELQHIAPLYPGLTPIPGTPEAADQPAALAAHRLAQFRDLVRWWQFPTAPLSPLDQPAFTHGSRIRKYGGHLDQVAEVVGALEADHTTSRGIVVLLHPEADKIATKTVSFPSFCFVQFKAVAAAAGAPARLECTAYFRKQEVRYWWLVNLAELADLQRQICESLLQRRIPVLRDIRPGAITIIAARAHAGESAPKVQVPRIDQHYILSKERLFAMVNALLWEGMPGRAEYATDWLRLFVELNPPARPDPDGVAIAQEGLRYLKDEVGKHLASDANRDDAALQNLHRALEQLLTANQEFALHQQREEATAERYNAWRVTVSRLIGRVVELSYGRITAVRRDEGNR